MALTAEKLATAMRLDEGAESTEPLAGIVARLLEVGQEFVAKKAPEAPSGVRDEAVIRLAAYLYDQPHAGVRTNYATAWRSSGARDLVAPWRTRAAVAVEGTHA